MNIATVHLGRLPPGADAIALIEVDEPMDERLLMQIRETLGVVQAMPLSF